MDKFAEQRATLEASVLRGPAATTPDDRPPTSLATLLRAHLAAPASAA